MTTIRKAQPNPQRAIGCPQCDWVSQRRELVGGQQLKCPRCGCVLERQFRASHTALVAIAIAALISLFVSFQVDFIQYSAAGVQQSMTLMDAALQLSHFHEKILAVLVLFTVFISPSLYLMSLIWVYGVSSPIKYTDSRRYLLRLMTYLTPWLMTDVFLLGTLVSLVKISSLAQIRLLEGFWSFSAFVVMLLIVFERARHTTVWAQCAADTTVAPNAQPGLSAKAQGLVTCRLCCAVNDGAAARCYQCAESLRSAWWRKQATTVAFIIAGAIMLVPAHWLPVMETVRFGQADPTNIIGGVIELWQSGDKPIATIVFVASLLIPVAKILVLSVLLILARWQTPAMVRQRLVLFKVTDWIGRWSMIDVFVVAILVALVRSGTLMAVYPGSAALSFAAAVVLTMLAAMSFDTRLFWREAKDDG